jgi:probable F420-dependent oxidoreductase
MMKIGVVFPQTESGTDMIAIRDYIQAVEGMGYTHLLAYDHVLGAGLANRPNWKGPYNSETLFHEVFMLFSYAAAITTRLEFVTGVLILPQRQTALVAKQAAQLDLFSGGRLRLGIGTGWNEVEYESLNEDFHNRGRRSEEQIRVLRALWTNDVVKFEGQWHSINEAGIKPLPVQRPIPIWFGGEAEVVLKRAARIGDGWFPQAQLDDRGRGLVAQLRQYIVEAGRKVEDVGIEPRLHLARLPVGELASTARGWQELDVTHLSISTMGMGFTTLDAHVQKLREARDVLGAWF